MTNFKREYTVPAWSIKPNITVLLPVYNQSKFLRNSLESILKQADSAGWRGTLRVKVLNDGSLEPIFPIIKDLVDAKLIDYKERANAGLPSALNELYKWEMAELSSSDFITWHSADNLYLPESLFKMSSFLSANPDLDFTFANVKLINEEGEPFPNSNYRVIDQILGNTSVLNLNYPAELLTEFSDNFMNACFLERRVTCNLTSLYNLKCTGFEDYVHWMDMALLGQGEHLGENSPLYQYRLHEETLTFQLKADLLVSAQKSYLDLARQQKIQVQNGNYQFPNSTLEIQNHLHAPHAEFQKLSTKEHRSLYGNTCFIAGSYEVPSILHRARERYLGLFGSEFKDVGRVLIFTPEDPTHVKNALLSFIKKNKDLGIILYSASEKSRAVADSLYLDSNLAKNLRIVDTREIPHGEERHRPLLNAVGSIDAIISISSFFQNLDATIGSHRYLLNDFCAEACLSAGAGRVILAPSVMPKLLTGPMPHIFAWDSESSLPSNIQELKTDLTNAHFEAILRSFSLMRARKKQIHSLIFKET